MIFSLSKAVLASLAVRSVAASCWLNQGCYTDISINRTLAAAFISDSANMTVENCINFCESNDYRYAGVEFSGECYCDYVLRSPGNVTEFSECSMGCSGDSGELCGAGNRLNLYFSGEDGPVVKESVDTWQSLGCFTDDIDHRTLAERLDIDGGVTAEGCTTACKAAGFSHAGLEFANECWCGNAISALSLAAPDTDCQLRCAGDHSEFCGGSNRLILYHDTEATQ